MGNEEQPAAELSKEERIEAYFVTDNEYWNHCAYQLYNKVKYWGSEGIIAALDLYRESITVIETNAQNASIAVHRLNNLLKGLGSTHHENWFKEFIIFYFHRVHNKTAESKTYQEITRLLEREINSYPTYVYERILQCFVWDEDLVVPPTIDSGFDWQATKQYLTTLPDTSTKIAHLIVRRAEYKQEFDEFPAWGMSYADQCQTEIKKLKDLAKLEKQGQAPKSPFKLSGKKGVKTNVIRLLNALYELRLIELENGTIPDKGLFIKQIGGFLGVSTEDYSQDLEQALSQSLEANVKVFDELKKKITEQVLAKENSSRK